MKRLRTAVLLAVVSAGVLLGGSPAAAGNWAVTSLDPAPERFEVNRGYTIGFWVLQHGWHTYSGKMDPVGLKLVDEKGGATVFPGSALPEPAHYAAAILVPRAGTWKVYGVQGPFEDYLVGTLTAPGALAILPVPKADQTDAKGQPWGAIRPPQVPVDPNRDPFSEPLAAPPPAAAQQDVPAVRRAADQAAASGDLGDSRAVTLVAVAIVAVAVAFALTLFLRSGRSAWFTRRLRRRVE
jgi:hypothetical protein